MSSSGHTLPHDSTSPAPAEIVLASQSPRRRRLLEWLSVPFVSTAVDTPEDLDSPLAQDPPALAQHLAAEKAIAARDDGHATRSLVLCFDTIVVLDGDLLGKPRDTPDAWRMLRALSGRTHQVVTGVAALTPDTPAPHAFSVTTDVVMKPLSDCQIEAWMAMGIYLGCAGAYNIEAQVAEVGVCDCYQNVAGLPLCHVYAALAGDRDLLRWLPSTPTSPVLACDAALQRRCELGPGVVEGNRPPTPNHTA